MEIGITRMSSKGQIVIPSSMRKDCPEGEEFLIIKDGERFILNHLDEFEPALREDIRFAEKTVEAFAEYEKGSFKRKETRDTVSHDKNNTSDYVSDTTWSGASTPTMPLLMHSP